MSDPTTPSMPERPDVRADARRAFDVANAGGIVLFPSDIGYGALTRSIEGLRRLHDAKDRPLTKRTGIFAGTKTESELHVIDSRGREIISMLVEDFDLPLGVIAPYDPDHPFIRNLSPELLALASYNGTMSTVINNGTFTDHLAEICRDEGFVPLIGSSANVSGTGQRFRLDEVQASVRDSADLILDYGLCKYWMYRRAATQIDFRTMEVTRIGCCYDVISSLLKRYFGIELPPDPGYDELPLGHLAAPLEPLAYH